MFPASAVRNIAGAAPVCIVVHDGANLNRDGTCGGTNPCGGRVSRPAGPGS
jgi:hypothetical protein